MCQVVKSLHSFDRRKTDEEPSARMNSKNQFIFHRKNSCISKRPKPYTQLDFYLWCLKSIYSRLLTATRLANEACLQLCNEKRKIPRMESLSFHTSYYKPFSFSSSKMAMTIYHEVQTKLIFSKSFQGSTLLSLTNLHDVSRGTEGCLCWLITIFHDLPSARRCSHRIPNQSSIEPQACAETSMKNNNDMCKV
jgi:hypothetical protein